jgi:class 3 adenylate cyclase
MEPAAEFATLFVAQSPGGYAFHLDAWAGPSRQAGFDPVASFGVTSLDAELRRQLQQAIDLAVENLHILHATDSAGSADPSSFATSPHAGLINQPLERLGGLLFSMLPSHLQDALSGLPDRLPLILATDDTDLPWELLHDGAAFLALRRPVGRRLLSASPARHGAGAAATQKSFLFISNPEGNLPEADVEVQELMESFDTTAEAIHAQFVCGQRATRIEVRERLASGQYALIHYSGHARPGALILADGELIAQEIQQSLRGQPFIFLNACQSARDDGRQKGSAAEVSPYAGASVRNLATAFLLGGARGFIGSLWQVFDARSRQFAAWFYALVREGAPVGEALRRSRAHLFPDPLWASFVLYGDPALQIVRHERREARWLSVLVVRLAGWSRLLATLTLDAAASLESRVLAVLTQIAERYGGQVHTIAGDALHVHFGMPTAHANDAERAVRAAADMVQAARTLVQDAPELDACRLRLGISTGQVIGHWVHAPSGSAYRMTSQPASLADLLAGYAEDEQLLVDEHTRQRAQGAFEFAPAPPAETAESAWRRDAPSVAVYAYRGAKRASSSAAEIVGREHELAQLHAWGREAQDGYGRWVGIVGAPGVGKTRLVQAFRVALTSQPPFESHRWVSAACHSYDESTSYSLLAQVIAGLAGIALEDRDDVRRDKLERLLRPLMEAAGSNAGAKTAALEEAAALLGQVIGLRLETPAVQNLEAQARQKKLAHLFGEVLLRHARAAQTALVVCVDDVHWSDEASLAILNHALAVAGRAPLLCLVTFRPDWSSPSGEWTWLGHYRQLTLDELKPDACHALLSQLLGAPTVPERLARTVLDHTGGNPFFIEAVLRWWQDSGKLVYADETWQLAADINGEQTPVPHTVESVIIERLDQLGEGSRAVLQTAAIIGPAFERSLLEAVLDANARETLEHSLSELAQRDMLEEVGGLWPDARYVFRHSLLHQTAYNSVREAHRRRLHRVVGHALRRRVDSSDGSEVERLAHHFFRSDDPVNAVRYCLLAARHAASTWAHQTACDWYDRALAALDTLAEALPTSTNAVEQARGVAASQRRGRR